MRRDNEILRQERELHKLRSVLQQATNIMSQEDHLLNTIQETDGGYRMTGLTSAYSGIAKKTGVSGQSFHFANDAPV